MDLAVGIESEKIVEGPESDDGAGEGELLGARFRPGEEFYQ